MKNKSQIERAAKTILNRVRFHAPVVFDSNVDQRVLFDNGVDVTKPIFLFSKVLTNNLLKAFEIASQEEEFNLLMPLESLGKFKRSKLKKIKNLVLFSQQTSPLCFVEMVNKLNINYFSSSNYNIANKDRFFKVGEQILNPHFQDFSLCQTAVIENFYVNYEEFVLNGINYFLRLQNSSDKTGSIMLELNLPLEKGYYYIQRLSKAIRLENLLTKEVFHLNFLSKSKFSKFSFSEVEGLENSVYCCVNAKIKINLAAGEETFVFFNFGDGKFSFNGVKEILAFEKLAKTKAYEIFDVQVKTKNPKFDLFFNKTLPQKIWINWVNSSSEPLLEEKYLTLKKLFVNGKGNLNLVCFRQIGLKEIGIFNGQYYKKILVVAGNEKFLRIGRTFFYNINSISMRSLKSPEPMSVCFGVEN